MDFNIENLRIGIIGLGYVGLPLAVEFGKHFRVIGFDINNKRISELKRGIDRTREIEPAAFENTLLSLSSNIKELKSCNFYIVTVPTPLNKFKSPDLTFLISASKSLGEILKKNDIVVYESMVYPGCTEEDCVPILKNQAA
jgi:UDP-N-acetyl-D-galactosamine dehydrogenase